MARPKRIDFPHSLYHVMSRTNSGDVCFMDEHDWNKFFKYLGKYCDLLDFKVHAFCLMPNHFHLLLESGASPALSEFMRRLLTAYTVYYNKYHGRHGHLFQGRFKSYIIEKSEYFLAVSRYIHLNPAKESDIKFAEDYPGSSFRHYLNGYEPAFLETKDILDWFKGDRKAYGKFVREGLNEETKPGIIQQRFIGGEKFARRINKRLKLMTKSGSRSSQAKARLKNINDELQIKKAKKILRETAKYFGLEPDNIIGKRWAHGMIGKARSTLIILLRDHVTWSHGRIAEFTGLKEKIGVSYHLQKKKSDKQIIKAISHIEKSLK